MTGYFNTTTLSMVGIQHLIASFRDFGVKGYKRVVLYNTLCISCKCNNQLFKSMYLFHVIIIVIKSNLYISQVRKIFTIFVHEKLEMNKFIQQG